MIITRQDPFSFRLQTGDTLVNFNQSSSTLELKVGPKRLSIETPGEYEMEGIAIESAPSYPFYIIHWDDMIIGLGGPIANMTYDILLLLVAQPRSGGAKALADTDARVLIPFGEEKMVASFLKELDENPEEMEKLTIKKKEVPAEGDRKIVALKPLKK
ncbi:MAG: hypothetical protein HY006_00020 [Candidatus Sungbacteria bacterium]|nr:hypothetical protein [Candidatus Sungbacteria bacterium]